MPLIIISDAPGIARAVARPPDGADEPVGAAVDHERGRVDAMQFLACGRRRR